MGPIETKLFETLEKKANEFCKATDLMEDDAAAQFAHDQVLKEFEVQEAFTAYPTFAFQELEELEEWEVNYVGLSTVLILQTFREHYPSFPEVDRDTIIDSMELVEDFVLFWDQNPYEEIELAFDEFDKISPGLLHPETMMDWYDELFNVADVHGVQWESQSGISKIIWGLLQSAYEIVDLKPGN